MHADTWASLLPCDLLVEILRRLRSTTAVIRCAGVCRPWRRAIIDNAWCLRDRVRPDHFLPHLLLTFVDRTWLPEDVLALKEGVGVDVARYSTPVSSRDGFLLLAAGDDNSLCLCNPLAGTCRFLPAAAAFAGVSSKNKCTYVLATGGDEDDDDDSAVRILAMDGENIKDGMAYQVFSSSSGTWGPVQRSAKLFAEFPQFQDLELAQAYTFPEPKHVVVVCGDSVVYWLVMITTTDGDAGMRTFAMDMRTGRTWTTPLPETCRMGHCSPGELVLATSGDGQQLSLVAMKSSARRIEVWVLVGYCWWTLRRTLDLQSLLLPSCPTTIASVWLGGFCPRSGCLFGAVRVVGQDLPRYFLVGVDGASPRLTGTVDSDDEYRFPYEMDWSTYISRMKYF